jgi:GNAT superfamily N-acetyltransferase
MQIRNAKLEDSSAFAALHACSWRLTYRGILTDEYLDHAVWADRIAVWRERLAFPDARQEILVAVERDVLLGFACAYGSADGRWGTLLDNLHTLPHPKGKGIGTALISEIAAWSLKEHPGQGFFLWVFESNAPARRFYERLGGQPPGETTWIAPDASTVQELRYAWTDPAMLIRASMRS